MKLNEIASKPKGKVICGFPGVGKSTLFNALKESGTKVLDSDSSKFDKSKFPQNYIEHIQKSIDDGYTILASSHDVVRDALMDKGIKFTLVYPAIELKDEYLARYKERGSPEAFITLLDKNWDKWINECKNLKSPLVKKVELGAKQFVELDKVK